ncbi:MAG: hypothetical protein HC855_05120 [Rhizobiales bacterium]|nr:hypothetical protein [Hyphomicrobiales bacterium]
MVAGLALEEKAMLEELVGGGLPSLNYFGSYLNIPGKAIQMSLIFSIIGTVLLTRVTAALGNLTAPLNFIALLIGSVGANYLLADVIMPFEPKYQKPFIVSLGGMMVAALVMMIFLKTEQAKAS